MSTLEGLLRQMGPLPGLERASLELLSLLDDATVPLERVVDVVSVDAALGARLAALANSAFLDPGRSDFSRATVLELGRAGARAVVTAQALVRAVPRFRPPLDGAPFWARALGAALCARVVAPDLGYPEPDLAYLAGLSSGIGEALLAGAFPERFARVWQAAEADAVDAAPLLAAEFGPPPGELAAHALRAWGLPEEVACAARDFREPEGSEGAPVLSLVVWAADRVCRQLRVGGEGPSAELDRELHDLGCQRLLAYLGGHPNLADEVAELARALLRAPL